MWSPNERRSQNPKTKDAVGIVDRHHRRCPMHKIKSPIWRRDHRNRNKTETETKKQMCYSIVTVVDKKKKDKFKLTTASTHRRRFSDQFLIMNWLCIWRKNDLGNNCVSCRSRSQYNIGIICSPTKWKFAMGEGSANESMKFWSGDDEIGWGLELQNFDEKAMPIHTNTS